MYDECTTTGQPWTVATVTIANRTVMSRTRRDRLGKCFLVFPLFFYAGAPKLAEQYSTSKHRFC